MLVCLWDWIFNHCHSKLIINNSFTNLKFNYLTKLLDIVSPDWPITKHLWSSAIRCYINVYIIIIIIIIIIIRGWLLDRLQTRTSHWSPSIYFLHFVTLKHSFAVSGPLSGMIYHRLYVHRRRHLDRSRINWRQYYFVRPMRHGQAHSWCLGCKSCALQMFWLTYLTFDLLT